MLKGAHVTINARNEEEVDSELIIEKVSKATGSAYSFKERGETVKASGPVVSINPNNQFKSLICLKITIIY